jgi:hypothetical protein
MQANPGRFAQLSQLPPEDGAPPSASQPPAPPLDPAVDAQILRDLDRTLPTHLAFQRRQGPGQHALYRVLLAYSRYDPEVGYVQVRRCRTAVSY